MERAKRILPRLFQTQAGQPSLLDELDLVRAYWLETVGPLLAEQSEPVGIEAGRLIVDVKDAPYLELLSNMRAQVVRCLRAELEETSVRTIEFRGAETGEQRTP